MRYLLLIALIGTALFQTTTTKSQGPDFVEDVYYVCNGERVAAKCAFDDKSDAATCSVSYPDRPKHNGFTVLQPSTRGAMRKLFATCQQPSRDSLDRQKRFEQQVVADQQRALDEQRRYVLDHMRAPSTSVDPGTLALRRCVTAGREPMQCLGEAFSNGFQVMSGGAFNNVVKNPPSGLRMTGKYGSRLSLIFTENEAIVNCDGAGYGAEYSVAANKEQVLITVTPDADGRKLGNKPFTLAESPSEKLIGSGVITVTGMVRVGQQNVAVTEKKYLNSVELNQFHSEPVRRDSGGYYIEQPATAVSGQYMPITRRCELSEEVPTESIGPTYAAQAFKLVAGSNTGAMFGGAPYDSRSQQQKAWPPPGLRFYGTSHGPGGLSLEFHEDSVVVSCGEVLSTRRYKIAYSGGQGMVAIENERQPILLTIGPNLTLTGTGSFQLFGNTFVGDRSQGNGKMYSQARATCSVGSMSPVQ